MYNLHTTKNIIRYTYLGFFSYFGFLVMGLIYDVADCNFLEINDMEIMSIKLSNNKTVK